MKYDDENLDYELNKIAAQIIRSKRKSKGYTQDEVIEKMDNIITKQSLFRYEQNDARMKNNIFNKICLALDEDPRDIWEEINKEYLKKIIIDSKESENIQVSIQIPILGVIKAGTPIDAQEDIIDYIDIPKKWTRGNKKYYALKISGDSMYPKYLEDDIVIFEYTSELNKVNKKDCAIMINDDVTFKNVTISDNGIMLIPLNLNNKDNYNPTFYSKEDVIKNNIKVIGVAREKRTRL